MAGFDGMIPDDGSMWRQMAPWSEPAFPARPDNICIHCDGQLTPSEMDPNNKTKYTCYDCWCSGKRNAVVKSATDTLMYQYYPSEVGG